MRENILLKKLGRPAVFLFAFAAFFAVACNGGDDGDDATTDTTDVTDEDAGDVSPDETGDDVTSDNLMEFDWVDEPCPGTWIDLTRSPTNLLYLMNRSTLMLDPVDGHEPTSDELGTCAEDNYAPAGGITFRTWWEEAGEAVATGVASFEDRVNQGLILFPGPGTVSTGLDHMPIFCEGSTADPKLIVDLDLSSAGTIQQELQDEDNNPICRLGLSNMRQALDTASDVFYMAGAGPKANVIITNGGPNCNLTLPRCGEEMCTVELYLCDGTTATIGCIDDVTTTADIASMYGDDNIKTYIVGIPGSERFADVFDVMAEAGGTAREGTPKYYAATTKEEIVAALNEIAESEVTCVFKIGGAPADDTNVNVLIDDQPLVRDDPDGFVFDMVERTIELTGQACQDYLSGSITDVQFLAGCAPFGG